MTMQELRRMRKNYPSLNLELDNLLQQKEKAIDRTAVKIIDDKINNIIDMQNNVNNVISSISDNLVRYAVEQYVIFQQKWTVIYDNLDNYCESATVDALRKRIAREIEKI